MTTYRTLFQRLKPEVLIAIYQDQKEFPERTESILNELNSKFFAGDVSLFTASAVYDYAKESALDSFNELNFYRLFQSH